MRLRASRRCRGVVEGKAEGTMNELLRKFAHTTSEAVGSSGTFIVALAAIVAWVMLGPYFRYSDTWQLVINTATTIVTVLMVFLNQNTQNRDAKAIHLQSTSSWTN